MDTINLLIKALESVLPRCYQQDGRGDKAVRCDAYAEWVWADYDGMEYCCHRHKRKHFYGESTEEDMPCRIDEKYLLARKVLAKAKRRSR